MNRREFLQKTGSLLALSFVPYGNLLAQALDSLKKNLLVVYIPGGWDITLFSEPWTVNKNPFGNSYFSELRDEDLLAFQDGFLGPCLMPLQAYFERLCVLNGVRVSDSDNGHDAARIFMQTGDGNGKLPVLSGALSKFNSEPGLGLAINAPVYLADRPVQLFSLESALQGRLPEVIQRPEIPTVDSELGRSFLNASSLGKQILSFRALLGAPRDKNSIGSVISATFKSGLSRFAQINLNYDSGTLDTHSSHEGTHRKALTERFYQLAEILNRLNLSEGSIPGVRLLDETTVVVMSEFARTPDLNTMNGKDHNPQTNTCLIFSPDFKSGIFGASKYVPEKNQLQQRPYLVGLPFDTESGLTLQQASPTATRLSPRIVAKTILKSFGVSNEQLYAHFAQRLPDFPVLKSHT